jgi:dihydropteroate synthase
MDMTPLIDELRWLAPGADARRADVMALAIDELTPHEDEAVAAASRGAPEVAVHRAAARHERGGGRALLVGPRDALRTLLERLDGAPADLPAIAAEIRLALDGYGRRHFDLRLGSRWLAVGPKPAIMGVVNVTPDSFSDGGRHFARQEAIAHGVRLAREGADLIDIGGESTRPGSDPVGEAEELARVIPVIEALAPRVPAALSIDTRHARVAREAVRAGASLINDITGLQGDPDMAGVAAETGAGVAIMHMLGEPKTMQIDPQYDHLMADICRYLRRGLARAAAAGVPDDAILVDPGIGFGKTLEHNLAILARLGQLRTLGRPILIGPSRKRFIGQLTGVDTPAQRTCGTAAACALAVAAGALVLRVHDVAEMKQALAVASAIAHAGEEAP